MDNDFKEELLREAEIIKNMANELKPYSDNFNKLVIAANMIKEVGECNESI